MLKEGVDYFRIAEIAEELRVTRHSVYRWVKAGTIPHVKIGGLVFIPRRAIEKTTKGEDDE